MTAVGWLTSVAAQKGLSTSHFLRSQGEGKRRSLVGGPFSAAPFGSEAGSRAWSGSETRRLRLDIAIKPAQILL